MNLKFFNSKGEVAELKQETVSMIDFSRKQKPMTYRQKVVLELIQTCLKEKTILNLYVLQDWFMEKIVKPRNHKLHDEYKGKDEKGNAIWTYSLEYDKRKREIKERGGLMEGYHLNEAKGILKYHIGNLVVNGYLVVLPTIKLEEQNQLIN